MTPQEEQLLDSLVERVKQTQLQEKDPDAEALLNRELGNNPDALYILAQTVLVQNIALDQAKAQVAQLQQARQQPARASSFLGDLLGHRDPDPPPQQAYVPPPPTPAYAQPQYQQPPHVPVQSGQPSFLRGAMQTAAGVAAGALAFEGVEAVLHELGGYGHPGYGWGGPGFGMGSGIMGGGLDRPVEETVINNYYDEPGRQPGMEHHDFEPNGEPHFHESVDQGGAHLSDASYDSSGDDQANLDDTSLDDGGTDDSSSFDDGGDFDDGGGDFGSNSGNDLV